MFSLLKNLWKFFSSKASFWVDRFKTPNPPCSLVVQITGQAAFETFFAFAFAPLHKQCHLYLSICSITGSCIKKVHKWNVGTLVKIELIISNHITVSFCSQVEETSVHLFLECDFAIQCWAKLGSFYNQQRDIISFCRHLRLHSNVPFFLEIIILMCWAIWLCRNDRIFKGLHPSPETC